MDDLNISVKQTVLPSSSDDNIFSDNWIFTLSLPDIVSPLTLIYLACLCIFVSSKSVFHSKLESPFMNQI